MCTLKKIITIGIMVVSFAIVILAWLQFSADNETTMTVVKTSKDATYAKEHISGSTSTKELPTHDRHTSADDEATITTAKKSDDDAMEFPAQDRQIMAWIFAGAPACNAQTEYSDGRTITILKPEYFRIDFDGNLELKKESQYGCNGYSKDNITSIKAFSKYQFITVSAQAEEMSLMLHGTKRRDKTISDLVSFAESEDITGIEIDFESYGVWSKEDYNAYLDFLTLLGDTLHANARQLMVDAPPISNSIENNYYAFQYTDMNALPVDFIVMMTYDYQFDQGAGNAVAPNNWLTESISWAQNELDDDEKLVVGIPSYGYYGTSGEFDITLITKSEAKKFPGFATATRDPHSFEMMWNHDGVTYVYQDSAGLDMKRKLIESMGVKHVSVWHLGGNDWFSN